jgi:hypothetical protein
MAGLDPAIHVFLFPRLKAWMPGSSPRMTASVKTEAASRPIAINLTFTCQTARRI